MGFVVEDGTGIIGANAYVTVAFVDGYLADRGRPSENGWDGLGASEKQQKIIAATDYIEGRWRLAFKGQKCYLAITRAKATLTFTGQPTDTQTITLGSTVYTFNTALGGANSILIGANTSASIDNLIAAINGAAGEGTIYGTGTVANAEAAAVAFDGDTMVAEARDQGTAGNTIVSTSTVTLATWSSATLIGGSDVGLIQPLSFPRAGLVDRDGATIRGIPDRLKQATSEYSVRAASTPLRPDPTVDDTGGLVVEKFEKVDVIEERTRYLETGRQQTFKPYPAADALLQEYLSSFNTAVRA